MKVLFVTMTVGEGHNQTAKALRRAFESRGAICETAQLYGFSEKAIARKNKRFLNVCKYIPNIYNSIWLRACKNPPKAYINGVIKRCKDNLLKSIHDFAPDAIVCTHNEAGVVLSRLRSEGKIDAGIKTYGIVLDHCLCPYWEYDTGLDFVVIPHERMTDLLLAKGFKREQLLPFGIPVDVKFSASVEKRQARQELGLDEEKFTVVIYSGGNCASSAYALIKKLLKCRSEIQIVSICGKNQKEFAKVEKLKAKYGLKNILNIGFCTCLDTVYSAGDVVITRGGGVGVSEQINKHIPLVLREKLITNEKVNKYYFDEIGLGIAMKRTGDATKIVDRLVSDADKLAAMREIAVEFSKPNATEDIINHVMG